MRKTHASTPARPNLRPMGVGTANLPPTPKTPVESNPDAKEDQPMPKVITTADNGIMSATVAASDNVIEFTLTRNPKTFVCPICERVHGVWQGAHLSSQKGGNTILAVPLGVTCRCGASWTPGGGWTRDQIVRAGIEASRGEG